VVALAGGTARPWGALLGSVVIVYVSKEISDAANGKPGIGPLTFAVVFIIMALLMPRGLSGTWAQLMDFRRGGDSGGALGRMPSSQLAEPGVMETIGEHADAVVADPNINPEAVQSGSERGS
jgi:hypothetical protein